MTAIGRRTRLAALAVLVLVLASACGGGDDQAGDVALDLAGLAPASTGLTLENGTLVKAETEAYLVLAGVETMAPQTIEITFGGETKTPGALLQEQRGDNWKKLGERIETTKGGTVSLDASQATAGSVLRVKITGGVGTSVVSVVVHRS